MLFEEWVELFFDELCVHVKNLCGVVCRFEECGFVVVEECEVVADLFFSSPVEFDVLFVLNLV